MYRLLESLLAIEHPAELRITLLILAKAARTGDDCPAINYADFHTTTGFSPATIAKALKDVAARGYVVRHTTQRKKPGHYQVLWDKLGVTTSRSSNNPSPNTPPTSLSARLEFYFINTGFLDLLPQARDVAMEMGFGEDEMIEAVCKAFDKLKSAPPTINRTAWFLTVYREKLREAHAEICSYRQRKIRTGSPF